MRRLTLSLAYRWHMANAYLSALQGERQLCAMHTCAAERFLGELLLHDINRRCAWTSR